MLKVVHAFLFDASREARYQGLKSLIQLGVAVFNILMNLRGDSLIKYYIRRTHSSQVGSGRRGYPAVHRLQQVMKQKDSR